MAEVLEKSQKVIQELDIAILKKTQEQLLKQQLSKQVEELNKGIHKREKLTDQFQQYTEQQKKSNLQALNAFQKQEQKMIRDLTSSFERDLNTIFDEYTISME